MPDTCDPAQRSKVMRAVNSKNTKPEMIVRHLLESLRYQFLLYQEQLPGKPDIVLLEHRKIIFVHGCFWHQHPSCKEAARPQSNTSYWNKKLDRNIQRDKEHITALTASGWEVLVIWECETRNTDLLGRKLGTFLENDVNNAETPS